MTSAARPNLETDMKCPTCEGEGNWVELVSMELGGPVVACGRCHETGRVSIWNVLREKLWNIAPERFMDWYVDKFSPYREG